MAITALRRTVELSDESFRCCADPRFSGRGSRDSEYRESHWCKPHRTRSQDSLWLPRHRRKTRQRPITANRSTAHTHTLFISFPHGRRECVCGGGPHHHPWQHKAAPDVRQLRSRSLAAVEALLVPRDQVAQPHHLDRPLASRLREELVRLRRPLRRLEDEPAHLHRLGRWLQVGRPEGGQRRGVSKRGSGESGRDHCMRASVRVPWPRPPRARRSGPSKRLRRRRRRPCRSSRAARRESGSRLWNRRPQRSDPTRPTSRGRAPARGQKARRLKSPRRRAAAPAPGRR